MSFYDERSCVASCESNIFINSSFDCVCEQFYLEPARLYRLVRFDSVEEPNYLLYIIDEVKLLVHKSQPDCTVIMKVYLICHMHVYVRVMLYSIPQHTK